jgi:hypothetical protein
MSMVCTCGIPDGELDSTSGDDGTGRQFLERGTAIALKRKMAPNLKFVINFIVTNLFFLIGFNWMSFRRQT